MPGMSIKLTWLPPFQGTPEIERTSATIQIRFGTENATLCWDVWSESVQDGARVAAYPFADVYELDSQYLGQLNTTASLGKQK